MGVPLIGQRAIQEFFGDGIGWPRVLSFIAEKAPIVKSGDQIRAFWISDRELLADWWKKYVEERLKP